MSFFDEADDPPRREPRSRPRTAARSGPRRRGPSRPRGRPPGDGQAVQVRRAVALVLLLIVIVVIALGIHSCAASADNSALQNYTSQVSSLITRSNSTSTALFAAIGTATSSGGGTTAQTAVDSARGPADSQLTSAEQLSVPSQMRAANVNLVQALRMRADGIDAIAGEIQPALSGGSASPTAVTGLVKAMALFFASDVTYKDYAVPEIYEAMNSAGVRFAGLPDQQFLPSLDWLSESFIASQLHVTLPGSKPAKPAPGTHGHELLSVSVAGQTLDPTATSTVSTLTPTFALLFKNSGQNPETDVGCKVVVNGTNATGTATYPLTEPGQTYTCNVTLSSPAPSGTQTVTATIAKVPGEKYLANNTATYTIDFPVH